jgi:hypothetical protein
MPVKYIASGYRIAKSQQRGLENYPELVRRLGSSPFMARDAPACELPEHHKNHVESERSPNQANRYFGVHLASKSHDNKSFVFSDGYL